MSIEERTLLDLKFEDMGEKVSRFLPPANRAYGGKCAAHSDADARNSKQV